MADGGLADEDTAHNWIDKGGAYVRSRVQAEEMVLRYCADNDLPAVAMCVANTYGPGDFLPTPHGGMLAAAVRGKLPFSISGYAAEVVGIEDAARALILAGQRGRVGQRYIVSERFMSTRELHEIGCAAVGVAPPKFGVPIRLMSAAGYASEAVARLRGRDTMLTPLNIRLMHIMSPMDHSKAVRELAGGRGPSQRRSRPQRTSSATGDSAGRGSPMTIGLTPEQDSWRGRHTVRGPARADRQDPKVVRRVRRRRAPPWWDQFVANGFHAVHLPEEMGGQGGTLTDTACVVEAAATALIPGPVLPTVTAGAVVLLADDTPARRCWARLPRARPQR